MTIVESAIFPTMIAVGKIKDHEKYHESFMEALAHDKVIANRTSPHLQHTKSFSSGIRAYLKEFLDLLTKEISPYAYHHFGINEDRCKWKCAGAWLNRTENGGFQPQHNHANSFLSVVYYVDLPEGSSPTKLYKPSIYLSPFMRFDPDFYHEGNFEYVIPQVQSGNFLIFPSYLRHEVPPMVNCDRPRVTFACNYIPDRVNTSDYVMELR